MTMRNGPVKIIGLDPGGDTGWATYEAEVLVVDANRVEYYDEKFDCGTLDVDNHHQALYEFLCFNRTHNLWVVCESFEDRQKHKELISLEYIGVVKQFGAESKPLLGYNPVHFQTASKGKGFWDFAKLKKLGLYVPGPKHPNDAMSHLLHYMAFNLRREDLFQKLK